MNSSKSQFDREIEEEQRRYRRWKWISWLGRLFRFGSIFRTDTGAWPDLHGEAPMAELAKLAKYGSGESSLIHKFSSDSIGKIVILFSAIAREDGEITDNELEFIKNYIAKYKADDLQEDSIPDLIKIFTESTATNNQLRNEVFFLSKNLNKNQKRIVVEGLFGMAYIDKLESKEIHTVTNIAERFGMKPNEIRLAQMTVRKGFTERR